MRKRERESSSRKLGGMAYELATNTLSEDAVGALAEIAAELDAGRAHGAAVTAALSKLTTAYWDEVSFWLPAFKRVLKAMP